MSEHSLGLNALGVGLPSCLAWPLLSLLSHSSSVAPGPSDHENLAHTLLRHIHTLSVSAYEELISEVLRAIGYNDVCVLRDPKRRRRSHKGRNQHGGVDITAQSRSGLASDAVLVQVKQYRRSVSRRFVDELRGALLRTESRHALLITTSHFSPAACQAAQEDHIAPIHLMDGNRLCSLLIEHQLGVWHDHNHTPRIDRRFFRRLRKKHPTITIANPGSATGTAHKNNTSGHRRFVAHPPAVSVGNVVEKGGKMMGRTHALLGITMLWLLKPLGVITLETLAPLVMVAVLGALCPDLDAGESKLKRFTVVGIAPFAPLSQVLHQSFGHRGLLHSLAGFGLFCALCSLPLALWLGWPLGLALSLGYASHLLADSATKSGIPLLYPRRKRYHLLPPGWRFTTGSLAEEMLLPFVALAVLLLLFGQLAHIS